ARKPRLQDGDLPRGVHRRREERDGEVAPVPEGARDRLAAGPGAEPDGHLPPGRLRLVAPHRGEVRPALMAATGLTLFEKIWNRHVVTEGPGGQSLLYIDRHLLHEGATHAFARLHRAKRSVRRPAGLVATADHYVPTGPGSEALANQEIRSMVENLNRSTREEGVTLFGP